MIPTPINLQEKLNSFDEHWSPKIIAQMNDCHFKLTKLKGDFVWHRHHKSDEVFILLHGQLRVEFRDGGVDLQPGDLLVVPKGVEHKPSAESECHVLFVESAGTSNTGDAANCGGTSSEGEWI